MHSVQQKGINLIRMSLNHGMDEVGRHLWRSASPTPLFKKSQSKLLRPSQVLNNAKDGDYTTSSVQPFSAPSPSKQTFLLMFQLSGLYQNSCTFSLVHSLRRLWLHLFYALSPDISFNHLSSPLLDSLQCVHMFLVLRNRVCRTEKTNPDKINSHSEIFQK